MDLVSIVIPTFKGTSTICRAVDSALNQDYKNIEIIVVDDNGEGSPEQLETERLMSKYKYNSKVKYIKHRNNMNGSAARNTGARISKGEYIALLDDDDVFLPFKIRMQVEALLEKSNDYAACYTSYESVFPDNRRRIMIADKEGDLCFDLLCMKVNVLSSVLLVRKSAWMEIGGFDESFKRDQDQEFCVRLFHKYKVAAVPKVCMRRYVMNRNVAKDVEKGIEYRKYYLEKMKNIIGSFSENQQKKIYAAQYTEMAKRYLKHKKILKCLQYIILSGTPFTVVFNLMKDYISYQHNVIENLLWSFESQKKTAN